MQKKKIILVIVLQEFLFAKQKIILVIVLQEFLFAKLIRLKFIIKFVEPRN